MRLARSRVTRAGRGDHFMILTVGKIVTRVDPAAPPSPSALLRSRRPNRATHALPFRFGGLTRRSGR